MSAPVPCRSSWSVSKAEVGSVIACPECFRPVRLKLMGAPKFPGRYVGIPKHERLATPKEKRASDNIVSALAPKKWDVRYLRAIVAHGIEAPTAARACADYLRFVDEIGGCVKLDYLDARPADEGFFEVL